MSFPLDEWHIEAMIIALIRLILEFVILFAIYFGVLGSNTNVETSWLFFATFYAFCVFVVPVQVQYELTGKYVNRGRDTRVKVTEGHKLGMRELNLWWVLIPYSMPFALVGAAGLVIYQVWFFSSTWLIITILAVLSLSTVLPMVLSNTRKYLNVLHQIKVGAPAGEPLHKQKLNDYYFTHHVFPWLPVTLVIGAMFLYKMSEEILFVDGQLNIFWSVLSVGGTCYALCFWMCYESVNQTKIDLMLDVFQTDGNTSLSTTAFFFRVHLLVGIAVGLTYLVGGWFWPNGFSQIFLMSFGTVVTSCCGAAANILGVTLSITRHNQNECN